MPFTNKVLANIGDIRPGQFRDLPIRYKSMGKNPNASNTDQICSNRLKPCSSRLLLMTSVQNCICDPRKDDLRSNNGVMRSMYASFAGPVAQSVERWSPYGGSICPGFKSPGFEARRAPDVYRASWRVWLRLVAGRSQSKSAIGTGRPRLCAYVKLSTLNSAIDPELRDRKVEDRANATSSA